MNREIFADVFNKYLYSGSQVLKPDNLKELDPTELMIVSKKGRVQGVSGKQRDLLKMFISDDGISTYVLGIENQAETSYSMPVRSGMYDYMQYEKQINYISKYNHENKTFGEGAEFLSGLLREDTINPIVTLVIYWGSDEWNGPKSLKEMYGDYDHSLDAFLNDYKVNLIVPFELTEDDLQQFHSELREIFTYIKFSSDKKKIMELFETNERFRYLSMEGVELLNEVTNSQIKYNEKEGKVDMCKAMDEIREDFRAEGKAEGKEEGSLATATLIVKNMVNQHGFDLDEVFKLCGISGEFQEKIRAEIVK